MTVPTQTFVVAYQDDRSRPERGTYSVPYAISKAMIVSQNYFDFLEEFSNCDLLHNCPDHCHRTVILIPVGGKKQRFC